MKKFNEFFEDYLFTVKNCLVVYGEKANQLETVIALARDFAIEIPEEKIEILNDGVFDIVKRTIPTSLKGEFYQGFPESVHKLSHFQLLYDQLSHYYNTYVLGDFSSAGHSNYEKTIKRSLFKGKGEIKYIDIITESQAEEMIIKTAKDLCSSTRVLNDVNYNFLVEYFKTYKEFYPIAGKTNLVKLVYNLKRVKLFNQLYLSDVYKLVEYVGFNFYFNKLDAIDVRLKSKDRRFVTQIIDRTFLTDKADVDNCFEKRAFWCGLLHQLHYKPKTQKAVDFVNDVRSKKGKSCYSLFNRLLDEGKIFEASNYLISKKGSNSLIRNIDYVLSRATNLEDVDKVLDLIDISNPLCSMQLLLRNSTESKSTRIFTFTKNNLSKVHYETEKESERRKTILSASLSSRIKEKVLALLSNLYNGKFGNVYIDEKFKKIALPLYESDSQSGLGVLTKGSRIPFETNKILRAFIYWEKVNDVDLACFGINKEGQCIEFSWRTNARFNAFQAVTYSGDQTSGYNGGSEYFDINFDKFKEKYKNVEYIVFTANCYSLLEYNKFYCKAGYMTRDDANAGNIYEPKTVNSAFNVTANGTYCILFAIDLKTNELVWINSAKNGFYAVAGEDKLDFIYKYLETTNVLSVYKLFELANARFVDNVEQADYVVSDQVKPVKDTQVLITSYDYSPLIPIINGKI